MPLSASFWRGRRVLVTGHTGFKGSWAVAMLAALSAEVHGFALAPLDPGMFDLIGLGERCRHRIGDIRDRAAVKAAVAAARPEIVLHMAAQPLVLESYRTPVETYDVNLMGTVNLLDACRDAEGLRAIVAVTTDKCYENVGWLWGYRENDRLGGADPYSNSKACAELAVDAFRQSFFHPDRFDRHGVALGSARAGNVIGGGDFAADRLVPDAYRAFSSGQALRIRNPLAVRPWQHVLEPLYGYLLLAERLCEGASAARSWNFGPRTDESASVGLVSDRLAALWGDGAVWEQDSADFAHEASTLKLDCTAARLELGWQPQFTLDEALATSVSWYRACAAGEDMAAVTGKQVEAYLAGVAGA